MRKNKYELMTKEELRKVNSVIVPRFGGQNRILSGSFFLDGNTKLQCHITVGETSTPKSMRNIKEIGKKVKMITNAHEVYCLGVKVA